MTNLNRREILKSAAWAAPIVVLAASAPAASASNTCEPVCYKQSKLGKYDVAYITITRTFVTIEYVKATDIIDINVHVKNQPSINVHESWPKGKTKLTKTIALPGDCPEVTFVQVHGNNTHYYGDGVFS